MDVMDVDWELQQYFSSKGYERPQDIVIDYAEIQNSQAIVSNIKNNYDVFCDDCMRNLRTLAMNNHVDGYDDVAPYTVTILNYNESPVRLKDLRGIHNNKLINVECVVRKVYEVKQELHLVGYICPICNHKFPLVKAFRGKPVPNQEKCPEKHKVSIIDPSRCTYRDVQRITIQEARTDYGKQPKSMEVYLYGDQCDKLNCGNRCTITAQVMLDIDKKDETANIYLDACNFVKAVDDYTEVVVTEEDIQEIKRLSLLPNIYDMWRDSINPMIYGYDMVKLALVLQMFGGVGVTYDDGSHQRGDSHVLLVGDPSMAKSQLIRSVSSIVPRGVYASGRSTSGAGLTAAAIKDTTDEKWYLEAGAMVLASGGMCIIDELDKMREEDRSALHEAMESQTISVNKAGLSEKLNTVCSVLAAANPKESRFIEGEDVFSQIDLPASLLSRFDLVFMLRDVPDVDIDKTVAGHVLSMRTTATTGEIPRPISIDMMRKYITYAKGINPELTQETKEVLKDAYVSMRKNRESYITVRQLEALERICESSARLKLRDKTNGEDAQIAIELFKVALKDLTLSDTIDVSVLFGAKTKRQEGIESYAKKYLDECPMSKDVLIQSIESHSSYKGEEIEKTINILLTAGKIYQMQTGNLMWSKR